MFSSLKRLTKHSAVYGIGHFITRVVNFLLLPLYTNTFSANEYGAAAVVFSFIALMTVVYPYGIDEAFMRYFILSDKEKERRQIFSTAFWSLVVVSCILSILIYGYARVLSVMLLSSVVYSHLFRLSSLILLFDTLAFLPVLYLRAEEKSVRYIVLKFINVFVNVALNIFYIVYQKQGVEGIFLANVWASAVTFLLLTPILFKQVSLIFDWGRYRELLRFGLPYLPAAVALVTLELMDRFVLEKLAGLEATGIYHAGYKLGTLMALFVAAFRFAWHPFFLTTSKQENAKEIFSKVFTYFTALGVAIFLVVSLFIDQIVRFRIFGFSIFGPEYWQGTVIVPIILLSYLLYGMYVNFIVGIYLREKTQYIPLVTWAGAGVNIIANILLIPKFGMIGSAYATLLGYVAMAGSLYFMAQKLYPIRYEFGRLLKLAAVAAAVFYFSYDFYGTGEMVVKVALLLGFPLVLFLTGFFEPREIVKLRGLLLGGRNGS